MALDAQDFELMKSLRAATRETGADTANRLDRVIEGQRKLLAVTEKSLTNDDRLLDAFNRMAQAMENLASEVRQLRQDLTPPLEKPKLSKPQ